LADVGAILVERHRFGRVAVDLVATTPDLGIPRFRGIGLGFAVKTADQLARQARSLLRWEAENVCKDVGGSHAKYVNPISRRLYFRLGAESLAASST
jgi:hypothetical protein